MKGDARPMGHEAFERQGELVVAIRGPGDTVAAALVRGSYLAGQGDGHPGQRESGRVGHDAGNLARLSRGCARGNRKKQDNRGAKRNSHDFESENSPSAAEYNLISVSQNYLF